MGDMNLSIKSNEVSILSQGTIIMYLWWNIAEFSVEVVNDKI